MLKNYGRAVLQIQKSKVSDDDDVVLGKTVSNQTSTAINDDCIRCGNFKNERKKKNSYQGGGLNVIMYDRSGGTLHGTRISAGLICPVDHATVSERAHASYLFFFITRNVDFTSSKARTLSF